MKKKIALIGVENSHAPAFANLMKKNPEKYSDIEIVGVYSYDGAAAKKMVEDGYAPMAADSPFYFLGKVDGVINTARHGDFHYEYSMPYIEAGIPMFIDKPFCIHPQNAKQMIDAAKKAGTPLCGGSSLKFSPELLALKKELESGELGKLLSASMTAPIHITNKYGNFPFYAAHLAQMLTEMFGLPESVYAVAHEHAVSALCHYENFEVSLHYSADNWTYSITVHTDKENKYVVLEAPYEEELDEFCNMLRTGKMERPYSDLTAPVALLNALYLSYSTGTEQFVDPIC